MVAIALPTTLEELLKHNNPRPVTAVLKRDGEMPVPFERDAIVHAAIKASQASRQNYTDEIALQVAEEAQRVLERTPVFKYSNKPIPHVEDVQAAVLEVLKRRLVEKEDPTYYFYKVHSEKRAEVRQKVVNLPYSVIFDSTDTQLHIHRAHDGESHPFNADLITTMILERTPVTFAHAHEAVKRVEEFLATRNGTGAISEAEITAIIDATLMEQGYSSTQVLGGNRLSMTLDQVEQLVSSQSVENSNIKSNNPEAVNLGIAELAQKELALRRVFSPEVVEAHKSGAIHIHDLGYINRVYCSAHSVDFVKKYGLDVIVRNLDAKSSPAKSPFVLNNHTHTFLAAIQAYYAGALGFPMLNTQYGPTLLDEVEMVKGTEIVRDSKGKIITEIPRYVKRRALEDLFEDASVASYKKESGGERMITEYRGVDGQVFEFYEERADKILKVKSREEMRQIAQNLVFGAAQSAFSRGGQTLFIDFNLDLAVPEYVKNVPALFLGGEYARLQKNEQGKWQVVEMTKSAPQRHEGVMIPKGHVDSTGKPILEPSNINGDVMQPEDNTVWATYGHELIEQASREFAYALLDVAKAGDKNGNPFNFPKFDVHVGRETFENPESEKLLRHACDVVEENDSVYFMYDRGDGMNVSQCCRLRERVTDPAILKHPEKMRFCGFQNISINVPKVAYAAQGDSVEERTQRTLSGMEEIMKVAFLAHIDKRKYIQKLFEDPGSPLYAMGGQPSDDGEPYIDLAKSTYIFGVVGLNEAVQHITGKQLHESPEAYKIGLKILSRMFEMKKKLSQQYGMKFVIEETPGESANRRMAKIDLINHPEMAGKVIKGNFETDRIYYTNSSHLSADAPVSGLDRVVLQSMMNPMIEAGAITHLFTGEKQNKAAAVYDTVKAGYYNTQSAQIVFSGEHSICKVCGNHVRGLKDSCSKCGNSDPSQITQKTRVVGYYSDPRVWNKSKKGELKARQDTADLYAGESSSERDLEGELLASVIEPGKTRIAIIGSSTCPVCDATSKKINTVLSGEDYLTAEQRERVEVVKYDVGTEDGRVMAAIYGAPIDSFPTVVIHQGDRMAGYSWKYPYNKPAEGYTSKQLGEMFKAFLQESPSERAA